MDRTYSHLDLDERRKIARWRTAKLSVDVIAEKLERHRSIISTMMRSRIQTGITARLPPFSPMN